MIKEIRDGKLYFDGCDTTELAKEYATRIIKLKDGEITSDSNEYDGKIKTNLDIIIMELIIWHMMRNQ